LSHIKNVFGSPFSNDSNVLIFCDTCTKSVDQAKLQYKLSGWLLVIFDGLQY